MIDNRDGSPVLWKVALSQVTTWTRLTPAQSRPVELYSSPDTAHVYWGQGPCTPQGCAAPPPVWVSTLDGAPPQELADVLDPAFSPDGDYFAYARSDAQNKSSLFVARLDRKTDRQVDLGGTAADYRLLNYAWSPDGRQLALQILQRDSYTGAWEKIRNVLLGLPAYGTRGAARHQRAGAAGHLVAGRPAPAADLDPANLQPVQPGFPPARPGDQQGYPIG